jgi:hypothetical protein
MKTHSTYHVDCLCGKPITSETRETTCPDCQRLLVFEWQATEKTPGAPVALEYLKDTKPKGAGA